MPNYTIDKKTNKIFFEGESFDVDEIKDILSKYNYELFKTITCPGEVKYTLSHEAKQLMRTLSQKNKNPIKGNNK